ncbi:uncharacterized protein A4U43_C10F11320 [Asparagus officinalis]|uniref:Pentatricopeptide repeat-containing protein n=1 Tax=Asparagus officinalis TaxID=4686 RepID=A0A5P1E2I3_ASPOF|nr:uncharacterized protein A4U43_C10F11320 [Asparagus officinalis]
MISPPPVLRPSFRQTLSLSLSLSSLSPKTLSSTALQLLLSLFFPQNPNPQSQRRKTKETPLTDALFILNRSGSDPTSTPTFPSEVSFRHFLLRHSSKQFQLLAAGSSSSSSFRNEKCALQFWLPPIPASSSPSPGNASSTFGSTMSAGILLLCSAIPSASCLSVALILFSIGVPLYSCWVTRRIPFAAKIFEKSLQPVAKFSLCSPSAPQCRSLIIGHMLTTRPKIDCKIIPLLMDDFMFLEFMFVVQHLLDATGFNTPGLHVLGVYVCRAIGQELVIESLLSFACLSANSCLPVLRAGVVMLLYLFKWSYGLFRSQVQELLPSVFITFMSWSISEKSGELAVYIGLNADNEIIHTISFLARVMIWSQRADMLLARNDFDYSIYVTTALIDIYAKFGSLAGAHCIFERMNRRSLIVWARITLAYASHGDADQSIIMSNRMLTNEMEPDPVTFTAVLSAYARVGAINEAQKNL